MADEATPQPQQPVQPKMQVLGQFIRDMSFENVLAQKGVQGGEVQPDINVEVSLDAKKRPTEHQLRSRPSSPSARKTRPAAISCSCWNWNTAASSTSKTCRKIRCIRSC